MKVELVDEFLPAMAELAEEGEQVSFYQTKRWVDAVSCAFPRLGFRALVAEEGGRVVGYLPFFSLPKGPFRYFDSMPFGTYGGPVTDGHPQAASLLLRAYWERARTPMVVGARWVDFFNSDPEGGATYERAITHMVDLRRGFGEVWRRMDKAKRRQARKGEREGLKLVPASSAEQVASYYAVYQERVRSWRERFSYPFSLFLNLIENGGEQVRLFLVFRGEEILGGHLNFYFKGMVTAWNGVTKEEAACFHASTFLYVNLLHDACERGFSFYNLGGSLGKESLEKYKASLGGEVYTYRIFSRESGLFQVLRRLKRKLVPAT